MFVGVTNRFGAPRDPARASRGALVVEALAAGTAAKARALFDALAASRFNPFHLLYADPDEGHVTWSDGDQVRHERLTPGLHVVTERSLGGDDRARAERVREAFGRRPLEDILRQHGPEGDPLAGTCVHVPALGYGTRSSLVLTIARDRARSQMSWAEGSPCTHPFEDRSSLLRDLFR
jgi:uncharacterized protein with NRDE domain